MVSSRKAAPSRKSGALVTLLRRAGFTALVLLGVTLLVLAVITPLALRAQILLCVGVFVAALLLGFAHRGKAITLALVLVSLTVSSRYVFWRLTVTLTHEVTVASCAGYLLLFAELYAYAVLVLGYLQVLGRLPRKPAPLPAATTRWPTIDIFIPTYSEPLAVVRTTVLAAKALDWPSDKMRIFLLDDGRRDAFRSFAAAAGVGYIVRNDNKHAKAGNLNHALARTRGEFVAIFDCDHVPTRSFLQVCMGWFHKDRRLAMLQTPHHFYSPDPFERNLSTFRKLPNEGELFYGLIQPSIDLWNASFFCGSCAVLRRTALDEVGGIAVETVTEDAHTALKMHRAGWNTAYLAIPQAAGLATESLSAHIGQRIRWARGMAQIFRLDNPFWGRGLTVMQRISYAAATLHFFYGLPRLIFLLAPLAYPFFGLHIFNALPLVALAYGLPHLAHSVLTNSRIAGRFRHSFWSEVYETCLAFYILIPTTVALIAPHKGKFNVTAKGGRINESYFESRMARPYLVVLALNLAAFAIGAVRFWRGTGEPDVLAVNLGWSAYNLVILCATVSVAWERKQLRESPRVAVQLPAMLALQNGTTVRCRTIDLASGGVSLVVPPGLDFAPREKLTVSIFTAADELPLPTEVVDQHGASLRLRFAKLSLEEESSLVQTIFSRADAWVHWAEGRPVDHPLASLQTIALRGLGNFRRIIGSSRVPPGAKPLTPKPLLAPLPIAEVVAGAPPKQSPPPGPL